MSTGRELIMYGREELLRDKLIGGSFEADEFNLWHNDELLRMLGRAVDEACLRSRLIVDSTTSAICSLAVTADDPLLTVDSRVHVVERLMLASQEWPLEKKSAAWLDKNILDWEDRTGRVEYYVWDGRMDQLRLVGIPEDDDTAELQVWRGPLAAVLYDTAPEIPAVHHYNLLHWVAHLAYLKENSNTYDKKKSDYHGTLFAGFFGDRPDAETLEQRRRHYKMRSPAGFF
jgi:hypothetical protein